MKERDVVFNTKKALTFMARGGLAHSLFCDPVEEDADLIIDLMQVIPTSQKHTVVRAIEEWRADHIWLENLPDQLKEQ